MIIQIYENGIANFLNGISASFLFKMQSTLSLMLALYEVIIFQKSRKNFNVAALIYQMRDGRRKLSLYVSTSDPRRPIFVGFKIRFLEN